jgi:hypothetical protein
MDRGPCSLPNISGASSGESWRRCASVSQPVPAQMSARERVRYVGAALRRKCAMPLRGLTVSGNQRA